MSKPDSKSGETLAEQLQAAGWRITQGRNSHFKAYCPCGQHMLVIGSTVSDHRSVKNIKARARRYLRECKTPS